MCKGGWLDRAGGGDTSHLGKDVITILPNVGGWVGTAATSKGHLCLSTGVAARTQLQRCSYAQINQYKRQIQHRNFVSDRRKREGGGGGGEDETNLEWGCGVAAHGADHHHLLVTTPPVDADDMFGCIGYATRSRQTGAPKLVDLHNRS